MKAAFLGLALSALALAAGLTWQDAHYRLDVAHLPADQVVVAHHDSVYTGVTWVASESQNYFQLRFFDKVEGGVCLRPTWADLIKQGRGDPRLAHLVPAGVRPEALPGSPDPGTLNSSAYISFFPAGLLLNQRGEGARDKPWKVLVVGLGSGVGIAHLAHHFPQVATTVVDIDPAVIAIVRERFPLLHWLADEKRADGTPRLSLVARDARQFIRSEGNAGHRYDLIILDAYTAGSTIPPHLMTREFFAECAAATAEGGLVLANVIGSYGTVPASASERPEGDKRLVVGGALRSIRAAGLPNAWCIPVIAQESPASFNRKQGRNMIVIAGRHAIDPKAAPAAWERLRAWVPYPELAAGTHVTRQYFVKDRDENLLSTMAPAAVIEAAAPRLAQELTLIAMNPDVPAWFRQWAGQDRAQATAASAAVAASTLPQRHGWDDPKAEFLVRRECDQVLFPREVFRVSVSFARAVDINDPEVVVGPIDGPERESAPRTWAIPDAPLFTDQTPNADILNR